MHGAILLLLLHQAGVAPLEDATEPIECYIDVPCSVRCVVAIQRAGASFAQAGLAIAATKASRSIASTASIGVAANKSSRGGRR